MSPLLTGETIRNGRVVPENEVDRGGPEVMSFKVREARTVYEGPHRRGSKGPTPAPLDTMQSYQLTGETIRNGRVVPENEVDRGGPEVMSFQVREAVTVTLTPPHWAGLVQGAETKTKGVKDVDSKAQKPNSGQD